MFIVVFMFRLFCNVLERFTARCWSEAVLCTNYVKLERVRWQTTSFQHKTKNLVSDEVFLSNVCGPCRARTGHLRIANAALYQMS